MTVIPLAQIKYSEFIYSAHKNLIEWAFVNKNYEAFELAIDNGYQLSYQDFELYMTKYLTDINFLRKLLAVDEIVNQLRSVRTLKIILNSHIKNIEFFRDEYDIQLPEYQPYLQFTNINTIEYFCRCGVDFSIDTIYSISRSHWSEFGNLYQNYTNIHKNYSTDVVHRLIVDGGDYSHYWQKIILTMGYNEYIHYIQYALRNKKYNIVYTFLKKSDLRLKLKIDLFEIDKIEYSDFIKHLNDNDLTKFKPKYLRMKRFFGYEYAFSK